MKKNFIACFVYNNNVDGFMPTNVLRLSNKKDEKSLAIL